MNVERFTKELMRCYKAFMDNKPFKYKGPKFKTNEILSCCFPIEEAMTSDHINKQIERGTPSLMQFFLVAYQMGYDQAMQKQKKDPIEKLLKKIKLEVSDEALKRSKGKSPKLNPPKK